MSLGHRVPMGKPRRWSKLLSMIQKGINIRLKLRRVYLMSHRYTLEQGSISRIGARSSLKMEKAKLGCVSCRLSNWLKTYDLGLG